MSVQDRLTLRVAGRMYAGWKSVSVRRGIEQLAGTYDLGLTERWPGQSTDWQIPPGERCEILIGDDVVITGYVDEISVRYDASSHAIRATGRDRAGDLVDCSAPSEAFSNLTLLQIAQKLCKPYGISVVDQTTATKQPRVPGRLPKQAVQPGESVFKTLEKLAKQDGVLLVSDGEGGLLITRAGLGGDCQVGLEFGVNILAASYDYSFANLYSEIVVKGQASAAGADKFDLSSVAPKGLVRRAAANARSANSAITRYRPLMIVAETQADARRCQERAQFEASVREAKARKISITVQGWREKPGGAVWEPNKRVHVRCPWMRTAEWWLIAQVAYKLDEGGSTAELTLTSEDAFNTLPEIPAPAAGAAPSKFKVIGGKGA